MNNLDIKTTKNAESISKYFYKYWKSNYRFYSYKKKIVENHKKTF